MEKNLPFADMLKDFFPGANKFLSIKFYITETCVRYTHEDINTADANSQNSGQMLKKEMYFLQLCMEILHNN